MPPSPNYCSNIWSAAYTGKSSSRFEVGEKYGAIFKTTVPSCGLGAVEAAGLLKQFHIRGTEKNMIPHVLR
jgi:hypothetical protein